MTMRMLFLCAAVALVFAHPAAAKISKKDLQVKLAQRASIINSIENKILRNQTQLKLLRQKLTEIENNRITQTTSQKYAGDVFMRLIRRPDNMPLVAGLGLVRGEKVISDLQSRNMRRLNKLAERNASIARLSSDIQKEQKALGQELKNRKETHKDIEQLLSQKGGRAKSRWEERTKTIAKNKKSASNLISAIIATEFGKKYNTQKKQVFFASPGAGTIHTRFGEKNTFGTYALGASFAMLSAARIIAPAAGLVIFAGTFKDYGKTIILAVPGNYHILLAGLVRLDVQTGDAVFSKEPLGLMPLSKKKPPLLYFEVRKFSKPINPEPLLQNRKLSP